MDIYRHVYQDVEQEHTTIFDGVHSTIESLATSSIRLAVVSNKGTAAVVRSLQMFDLEQWIDRVFGAEAGSPLKPDPALYELRIQPAYPTMSKSTFLMVGDTVADLEFANKAGIASCWASFGYGDPASCRQLNPRFTIQRFPDLASIVS